MAYAEKMRQKIITKDDDVPIQSFVPSCIFTEQRSETRRTFLVEQGYITMNNAIKIENVGIFYPFPHCRGGMIFMQTIADVPRQRSRIYAYALHFSVPDKPSRKSRGISTLYDLLRRDMLNIYAS